MTLIELIVAISIFMVASVLASQAVIYIYGSTNKAKLHQELYDDTRFVMERIVKEVRENTIDYEEYWSKQVLADADYGKNYGEYAKQFIDPGETTAGFEDELGTLCIDKQTDNETGSKAPCPEGERIYGPSVDEDMGRNPRDAISADDMELENALCDDTGSDCTDPTLRKQEELYLINGAGTKKTILKRIANDYDDDDNATVDDGSAEDTGLEFIGMLKMDGKDTRPSLGQVGDGYDGIADDWINADDFSDFVSIVPPHIEITNLEFYIAPLEDPWKAYNEESPEVQIQPYVIIQMTARASSKRMRGVSGVAPELTLQTAVSTRVLNGIKSF